MSRVAEPPRRRWFGRGRWREDETRDLTRETLPAAFVGGDGTSTAPGVREAAGLADVFGAVHVLSDGAIMCPIHVYRRGSQGREQVRDGDTVALLDEPAPGIAQPAFVGQLVSWLALWGECFIGKYRAADGSLSQLGLLPPDKIEVEVVAGEPRYKYHPTGKPPVENLTRDDVIHVRSGLTLDGIRGASPIRVCREAMALGRSLAEAAAAVWSNGAEVAGLFAIPPGPGADDQAKALLGDLEKRHKGPKNRGKLGVATGDVTFHQITMSAADAEFIETRRLSTLDVCRLFHLQPWMLAADTGSSLTYSTVAEQQRAFAIFSLSPWLRLAESALSADRDLFPQPNHYARFELGGLLRADPAARAAFYTAALDKDKGWMTRAEVRALEDLPAEEDR
ncbi:MAG: phage portal protein [Solirubrobacterales bacterium]